MEALGGFGVGPGAPEVIGEIMARTNPSARIVTGLRESRCLLCPGLEEARLDSHVFGLTEREYQVLTLMVEGLCDKEIAVPLGISRFTVNKHVRAVMGKMEASSRTEAAVRAIRMGIVS